MPARSTPRVPALVATDPGARRSLVARLVAGPRARRLALVDLRLFSLIRGSARDDQVVRAVHAYSKTGEHAALWLATGIVGATIDRRRRSDWIQATGTIAFAQALNSAIKLVARRRRPVVEHLPALISTPTSLSFPSSHSTSSFAAAQAFRGFLPAPLRYGAASTMALSRVFLGVHYPTDIVAGATIGTIVGRALGPRPRPAPKPPAPAPGSAAPPPRVAGAESTTEQEPAR